jgi:hypothetical protein
MLSPEVSGMDLFLTRDDVEQLMRPIRGRGGWQSLLRKLQRQLVGQVLSLTAVDIGRIERYRSRYGKGGWQSRLSFLLTRRWDSAA